MNRRLIISAGVLVVVGVVVLALLQFVFHTQGAVLKLIIGIVIALIAGGATYMLVKEPGKTSSS